MTTEYTAYTFIYPAYNTRKNIIMVFGRCYINLVSQRGFFQYFHEKEQLMNTILHYSITDFVPDRTPIYRNLLVYNRQYNKTVMLLR